MDTDEFINTINEIRQKYDFAIQENCDYQPMVNGLLFYRDDKSEKPFAHITGISYKRDGTGLDGDFVGFIKLLNEAVIAEYGIQ